MTPKCYRTGCTMAASVIPVIMVPIVKGGKPRGLAPMALVFDGVCERHQHSLTVKDYLSAQDRLGVAENARIRGLELDWSGLRIKFKAAGWRPSKNGRIRQGEL